METQVQRPEQRENVHQDEQNHGGHDKCHLQLVVAHSTRRFKRTVGLHISNETYEMLWNGRVGRILGKDGRVEDRITSNLPIFQSSNLPIVTRRSSLRPQRFPRVFER